VPAWKGGQIIHQYSGVADEQGHLHFGPDAGLSMPVHTINLETHVRLHMALSIGRACDPSNFFIIRRMPK